MLGGAEQLLSGVLADDAVRAAYLARTGQPAGDLKAAAGPAKQKSLDSDACPICFDELTATVRAWQTSAPYSFECGVASGKHELRLVEDRLPASPNQNTVASQDSLWCTGFKLI